MIILSYGLDIQVYSQIVLGIYYGPAAAGINAQSAVNIIAHILQELDYLITVVPYFEAKVVYAECVLVVELAERARSIV